ncbi:VRR-NUC domain-containing protein [Roseomonas elaeocarpi]|uniref:VRR-NUC domain-containing protein n=1 Tax=Roseomonas elaeocarpi TaxID=907779 RepID=A0ABV6JUE1_9PROT
MSDLLPRPSEREIQRQLLDWMALALPYGSVVHHAANEAAGDPARSKRARAAYYANRHADGVLDGFPDLIVIVPPGKTVLLEVKKHNGRVSPEQVLLHQTINAAGVPVAVVRSVEEASAVLAAQGIPLRQVRL